MERQHGGHESEPDRQPPDRDLIDRVRAGDLEAYDPLYQRHERSALLHARHWARTEAAAQDLRAEAFTRVLHAIRNGNGPTEALRPYLLTTMRHVARDWAEGERRLLLVADLVDIEAPGPDTDPVIAALERSLAGQAFMALPQRWQTVLWHTEVEGEGPAQLAPLLGMEPAAVAALAYRAREGLKQAYLQAHINEIGDEACRPFAQRLGAAARGKLGPREDGKVRAHLHTCAECTGLLAMLKYVNAHIGALAAPAVLGSAVAAKAALLLAAGAGSAAGASGTSHAGVLARGLSKARRASPRQQAVAAATVAAVAAAALAFALTGSQVPAPGTAPSRSPVAALPPSPPATLVPAPAAPKPSPSHSSAPPSQVRTSAPPPARPGTKPAAAPPSSAAPSPPAKPSPPTPTPSPTHVMCPAADLNVLGLDLGLRLRLQLTIAAGAGVGAGRGPGLSLSLALPPCRGGGPATRF
ncbi:MAG: sigma factor [Actinocrinis sp.]